jgi:hypothetical protein
MTGFDPIWVVPCGYCGCTPCHCWSTARPCQTWTTNSITFKGPPARAAWECTRCRRVCAPHVDHCDCPVTP